MIRILWILMLFNEHCFASVSYNLPKFSSCAAWHVYGIIVANESVVGSQPYNIFINTNNTIYVPSVNEDRIVILNGDNYTEVTNLTSGFNKPQSIFVSNNGDIYVDDGKFNQRIVKWSPNSNESGSVTNVTSFCRGLFIDQTETLYCSIDDEHKVVKVSLSDHSYKQTIVAGNGTNGSEANMLHSPKGIFVDLNSNLYVADYRNDRIQYFQANHSIGITVAGENASGTVHLRGPIGVVLDGDGYLFITDHNNHRIIRSGPTSFHCLIGCSSQSGTETNQLHEPKALGFDSFGNIFVADGANHRILKFLLLNNSCGLSYNLPKLSSCATWNPIASIFVDNLTVNSVPYNIFIDTNNNVYVSSILSHGILLWDGNGNKLRNILSDKINNSCSIFITKNGEIYVDNGLDNKRVDKWTWNATKSTLIMNVTKWCRSLFVDVNNTLYCSQDNQHKVVKVFLIHSSCVEIIAAGNGMNGTEAHMLNSPKGIFVDFNFNLYVADHSNHRIQRFRPGQINDTTVAGQGVPMGLILNNPNGVILDADGYLFIADYSNYRIIRAGWDTFRCLVGCSDKDSLPLYELSKPTAISFDSYGNIFSVDVGRGRILKFHLVTNSCAVSYNRPKLCVCTLWNSNAINYVNITTIGNNPFGMFVNTNNTVYVAARASNQIIELREGKYISKHTFDNISETRSLFVNLNGDLYIDNGDINHRVDKWNSNITNGTAVMNVTARCISLFVDVTNILYCCIDLQHQVLKVSLGYGHNVGELAAGNGTNGSTSYLLDRPHGIFVDTKQNLYIADSGNNRIQLFRPGNINGTTVAGNNVIGYGGLNFPTSVVLDADDYLFIADRNNHRIIRSEQNGFRCIVGCSQNHGSASHQLYFPQVLWFDSYGNLFVLDKDNNRVQKFHLSTNSCNEISLSATKVLTCWDPTRIGLRCDIPNTPCHLQQSCQNNGTCHDIESHPGYNCSCKLGFYGIQCEFDRRPCREHTCWNGGTCNTISNTTFNCTCLHGWEGIHCERMINLCYSNLCQNRGVCRPLLLNYSCECIDDSYSGRHYEIIGRKIIILQTASKSFAYIAILAIIILFMFVIIMDILKYDCGIDPIEEERQQIQRAKRFKTLQNKTCPTSVIEKII